jgi:hypothetical protein
MTRDSSRWSRRLSLVAAVVVGFVLPFIGSSARAQEGDTDLDRLMARVLERRNETWKALHDYVLDERERFALVGPADLRLFGGDRSYTWYVQDGVLVRSPVKFNGVTVAEGERRDYEQRWLKEENDRAERARARAQERAAKEADEQAKAPAAPGAPGAAGDPVGEGGLSAGEALPAGADATNATADVVARNLEPRFVSEANFLRFRFEKGRYFLVGRETLEGRQVLKVEYYPQNLFKDDGRDRGVDEEKRRERDRERQRRRSEKDQDAARKLEQDLDRKFNKVSLVTLWIDPAESQIVKYEFENLGLDFLPGRWLVRVGETTASMTMGRYFDGVWLPKAIAMKGDLQVAVGSFDIEYEREFLEYRKAETSARIRAYGDVK